MGESYAGVYVPYLSYYIDQYISIKTNTQISFKGFAVGNPVTHPVYDSYSDLWFWTNHGLLSPAQQQQVTQNCEPSDINSDVCDNLLSDFYNELQNINIYDIYRHCYFGSSSYVPYLGNEFRAMNQPDDVEGSTTTSEPDPGRPPCVDDVGAWYFFNNATTREALHIWPNASVWQNNSWYMCANINYNPGANASFWIYPYMIQKGYKILVYSGDTDGAVPTDGTLLWTQALATQLGLSVKRPYMPWTLPGVEPNQPQIAGYVINYSGFQFTTVRGVGHMVPQWNRPAAYKMIYAFLTNQELF